MMKFLTWKQRTARWDVAEGVEVEEDWYGYGVESLQAKVLA